MCFFRFVSIEFFFFLSMVSVIRSKTRKKNEREREVRQSMRERREYHSLREERCCFFLFFADASVLHWPPPALVFLSFSDDGRGQKNDDLVDVGRCNW